MSIMFFFIFFRSPKNLKYFLANIKCLYFFDFSTRNLTYSIIPTCHILLCVYLLFLYKCSNFIIVSFTSCTVVYLIGIVSSGFLSI